MKWTNVVAAAVVMMSAHSALAQGAENPDFRVRAKFRTANDGAWAADESVGHAEFRIKSRFMQVYYGGVHRQDEYRFSVQIDFRDVSGFAENFADSQWDTDWDVYINNGFVGRVPANSSELGLSELQYDSRHPDADAGPIPAGFPDVVDVGDVVSVFAASGTEPAIGDPLPGGVAVFQQPIGELFARGDVNQDGKVDDEDFPFLANGFDPFHALQTEQLGPANGDFTGDSRSDMADYDLFVANWTDSQDPPAAPAATAFWAGDVDQDGTVGVDDLQVLLFAFGTCAGGPGDVTGNGCVDLLDLNVMLLNWGTH
ncbi:MAG: hypothetical protein KDA20_06950 [Phycisphaerales bacterium]|nr:hypothetical protein [Phycisphaerales bacterium]